MSSRKGIQLLDDVAAAIQATECSVGRDEEREWFAHIGPSDLAGLELDEYRWGATLDGAVDSLLIAVEQAITEKLGDLKRDKAALREARDLIHNS